MIEIATSNKKDRMREVRKILHRKDFKYGITEDDNGIYVFTYGIVIENTLRQFKEWFKDFDCFIYKSKPEELTIEFL
jgi:isocitrate dehydrogenase